MYKKIPTVTPRIHPLVAAAAISVMVLSFVATAAIAGWLPAAGQMTPAADSLSAPVPAAATAAQVPSTQIARPRASST